MVVTLGRGVRRYSARGGPGIGGTSPEKMSAINLGAHVVVAPDDEG